ncbi:iron chelate uptake ABC transporter family permease subunit [Shimia sp. R11_0]|uniref:FecCD family ABC transporter permease n=1 Tax=Shimia sp. R11_0 TaxID=2821096 RepID=UPI001AD96EAB|nr:iron chelate uptake ABC transporter family permease subunit [Shimia sp. R11_0]
MNVTLQTKALSFQTTRRAVVACLLLLTITLAVAFLSLKAGAYPLSVSDLFRGLIGHLDDLENMIVREHRLPRILVAIGAGAAFGMAGAMMQSMLRNPLASPDVIGFTAGANFGALLCVLITGGMVVMGALLGGLGAAILVTLLAWQNGLNTTRLILVGIGINLTLGAGADLLLSWTDERIAADMARWLTGSLNTRSYDDVALIWGGIALLTPLLAWLQFPLARLAMNDDTVTGLGIALTPTRLAVAGTSVALVALSVSVAGPLPFVAFVAGPIARRIIRGGRPAIFAAALVGAAVTLIADLAARSVPLIQLPAGVFTALIGAPVLLWLLVVQFRKGNF